MEYVPPHQDAAALAVVGNATATANARVAEILLT
jgi:hypothetical protein